MALAAYLVYETRIGCTLEDHQGDAAIDEQEKEQREDNALRSSKKPGLTQLLGIVLLLAAVLFLVAVPALLLTPLPVAPKAGASSGYLVPGAVACWRPALVRGREVGRHYRRCLRHRDW